MIFIESNIWCYYFDQRLPEHKRVIEPIRQAVKSAQIVCNTIIVMEVAHYLVRHFDEKTARKKIDLFINLQNLQIVDFNQQTMTNAIEHLIDFAYSEGLGGRDATMIATAKSKGVSTILSHDDIFKRLACKLQLEIVDPIKTI